MKKIFLFIALSFICSAVFAQEKNHTKHDFKHNDSIHKHHHDSIQRAEWKKEKELQKRTCANFLAAHPNFYADQKAKQAAKK